MEKIIHKYLSKHYYIDVSQMGKYGIYNRIYVDKVYINKHKIPYDGDKLISDITTMFGVNKDTAFKFISNWVNDFEEIIDLTFYWKDLKKQFVN